MKGQGQKLAIVFLAVDLSVVAGCWLLAYAVRFKTDWLPPPVHDTPPFYWCVRALPLMLAFALFSMRRVGLYKLHRLRTFGDELFGIAKATLLMFLLMIVANFYMRDPYRSRLALGLFLIMNTAGLVLIRRVEWAIVHWARGHGYNPSQTVIVGTGRMAQKVAATLQRNTWTGLEPIGFIDDMPHRRIAGLPVLGTFEQLPELLEQRDIGYVFVALPLSRYGEMRDVMRTLEDTLVDVRLVPDFPNLAAMSLGVSRLGGVPIVSLRENPHYGRHHVVKRSMDIILSSLAILVLSPVLFLIAAVIKIASPGPVFYKQERASMGGERFQMLKFRSMKINAEDTTGPVWASENDPRRTRIGEFLRATSMDELPQLINVLKGDMSLVGPRPERPIFIKKFRGSIPNYMVRHKVKAGITGWAQVNGWRGNTSLRKRVQYDLYYITHWSPWLDIRILFLTVLRGMINRHAY